MVNAGNPVLFPDLLSSIGLYELKVEVGMLNTMKICWADISSISPSLEQKKGSDEGLTLKKSVKITLHSVQHTHINSQLIHSIVLLITSSYRD